MTDLFITLDTSSLETQAEISIPASHQKAIKKMPFDESIIGGFNTEFDINSPEVKISPGHIMCFGILEFRNDNLYSFVHQYPRSTPFLVPVEDSRYTIFMQFSNWSEHKEYCSSIQASADHSYTLLGYIDMLNEYFNSVSHKHYNLIDVRLEPGHDTFAISYGDGFVVIWQHPNYNQTFVYKQIAKFSIQEMRDLLFLKS